jgi:hypothetical protein
LAKLLKMCGAAISLGSARFPSIEALFAVEMPGASELARLFCFSTQMAYRLNPFARWASLTEAT